MIDYLLALVQYLFLNIWMQISIKKIKSHPKNKEIYTLSNLSDLSKSIAEIGLLEPIVINQNNQIISGNRRYEAIKSLKWNKVDVIKVNIKFIR